MMEVLRNQDLFPNLNNHAIENIIIPFFSNPLILSKHYKSILVDIINVTKRMAESNNFLVYEVLLDNINSKQR